jgi:hypothetical protein
MTSRILEIKGLAVDCSTVRVAEASNPCQGFWNIWLGSTQSKQEERWGITKVSSLKDLSKYQHYINIE